VRRAPAPTGLNQGPLTVAAIRTAWDRIRRRSAAVRRQLSIARPSHRTCAVSQGLCVQRTLKSQIMCARRDALLHVRAFIIACRHSYRSDGP
jgi:hypothetical protein